MSEKRGCLQQNFKINGTLKMAVFLSSAGDPRYVKITLRFWLVFGGKCAKIGLTAGLWKVCGK